MPSWRWHSHRFFQLAFAFVLELGGHYLNGKLMGQILVKIRNGKKETYIDGADRP